MIGSLLKQIVPALGRFAGYHTRRILRLPEKRPASRPVAEPVKSPTEPNPMCTATGASIAGLSDEIGLASGYTKVVPWSCFRSDVPPDDVREDPLYKLWTTIPQGLKWTQYFHAYRAVFGPLRSTPLRILEIGIWQGASLQLWKQYFDNPQTIIVGVDVLPECKRFDAPDSGVHIRIGNQADPIFLKKVVAEFGPFDLIIDDGSHVSSHIITSFNHLFDGGLKDSGIYFVEDMHANYWHPWRDSKKSFLDVCKELLEHMHAHYRNSSPQDLLIDTPSVRETSAIDVPRITTMIKEIRFFDSMVAIYKTSLAYVPYFLRSDAVPLDE